MFSKLLLLVLLAMLSRLTLGTFKVLLLVVVILQISLGLDGVAVVVIFRLLE